ncbi:hypothetical protein BX285_1116 [Streptomyces sp. 1114.5]|uniref:hypothetical protein n=1 Tax=Streptomyces sp. 1114.5 TaxID=1938830 RepID=UPI000EB45B6C|nr:hypothetical protein [Streptomyces sp. 1114.5]RKT16764.1 hypothetical protein BX285_1116 [Streptomyces sp. 1114.5]
MSAHLSSPDHAGDHPSIDRLADLAEDLVDSPDAVAALRRHLAGCAECRETVEALAGVRELLGSVEAPPMPADVAARLDAALAVAAAGRDAEQSDQAAPKPADRPQEAPAAPRRAATPAPTVRTATGPSAPPSRPGAATGPGRPRPKRRRIALLLGTAAALAAIGLGGALLLHPDDRSGGSAVTAAAPAGTTAAADQSARTPHAASPGTVYEADRLATQVQQLLARSETAPGLRATGPAKSEAALPAEGARPELTSPGSPSASPSAAPSPSASTSCPAPASGVPLATDRGTYRGSPVDVLVYPAPGTPGFVEVYLRSPDCGPIVLQQTVPSR